MIFFVFGIVVLVCFSIFSLTVLLDNDPSIGGRSLGVIFALIALFIAGLLYYSVNLTRSGYLIGNDQLFNLTSNELTVGESYALITGVTAPDEEGGYVCILCQGSNGKLIGARLKKEPPKIFQYTGREDNSYGLFPGSQ